MAITGMCGASLQEPKVLMKMGLCMVLIGHINFLLAALVHGAVLRHIQQHEQARTMEYAIFNVVALVAGLLGVIAGILAIVVSKNTKINVLTWSLFFVSLFAGLLALASAIGVAVSVGVAIGHGGQSLLTHCRFPDAVGYSSVNNECPFDPTRIYSTTLILWVPLIVTCIIQLVFSVRCFATCVSFLGLPCRCLGEKSNLEKRIITQRPMKISSVARSSNTFPQAERQPLHRQQWERPYGTAEGPRAASEHYELLARGASQRPSFWI